MSPPVQWGRLLAAAFIALPLAVLSGAQALSSAAVKASPERALAVFARNGLASEAAAYRTLTVGIRQAAGLPPDGQPQTEGTGAVAAPGTLPQAAQLARFAATASGQAREAIRREPLAGLRIAPRAYILLALAETDPAARRALIQGVSRLTRREPVLQVLVLEERGKAKDYAGVMETLDQMLRVNPERRAEFFPVLAKALEQQAAVPGLTQLLARPVPWRGSFLNFAVADGVALGNLAVVRERIMIDDPEFDRKLIARLAESGDVGAAERIYAKVAPARASADATARWEGWSAAYPPFDWQLADQPGFRAQTGDGPDTLAISVKPGNGGVIAARLLRNPGGPFVLRVANAIDPPSQAGDMKLAIACYGAAAPFLEGAFTQTQSVFAAERVPECRYLSVSITARAWTGGRELVATLSRIGITRGQP